jgi:adenylylsulfate kinase-like enzyme
MNDFKGRIKTLWISGISSAGKTTLARQVINRLQENSYPCLLIDGNETRDIFQPTLGFDPVSRRKQTKRIMNLATWVIKQKIIPVVAMIHPFEEDRIKCLKEIPGYYETHLKCNLDECIRRDQKKVYSNKSFIVGMDIPYEEPVSANNILESDKLKPEQLLELLWSDVSASLYDNRLDK